MCDEHDDENETPILQGATRERLITGIEGLLRSLDPSPEREGLSETPMRYVKAWEFWTSGHSVDIKTLLKTFQDGAESYDEMVFIGSIPFYSHCEHHLAPFFGVAHVAYIPDGKIVGLSKIPRLVDAFARRLSVQERLTTQVADAITEHLTPKGVGVIVSARHMCMESRGVQKPGTVTTTSALRGLLKEPDAKAEFMSMVAMAKGVGLG
jgi:GTP cyclohydrolase I